MADNLTGLVIGGAVVGAAALGYHMLSGQATPVAAAPAGPPGSLNVPANLAGPMQLAANASGVDIGQNPNNFPAWINAMNTSVAPLGGQVWNVVYTQWRNYVGRYNAWPSDGLLHTWVNTALTNYQ